MNIQTVEKITGLSKRMIRHYEDFGLISPKRGENSYREYTDSDVEQGMIRAGSRKKNNFKMLRSHHTCELAKLTIETR
ncbi:MAG: MerR family transcriptional regulator [Bdellovibrio sp.]|nr:MerR family transcriptional regulator [Bdellovibrio sp.]